MTYKQKKELELEMKWEIYYRKYKEELDRKHQEYIEVLTSKDILKCIDLLGNTENILYKDYIELIMYCVWNIEDMNSSEWEKLKDVVKTSYSGLDMFNVFLNYRINKEKLENEVKNMTDRKLLENIYIKLREVK